MRQQLGRQVFHLTLDSLLGSLTPGPGLCVHLCDEGPGSAGYHCRQDQKQQEEQLSPDRWLSNHYAT